MNLKQRPIIAYSSNTSGNREIYLTDDEGKSKIKITNYENADGYPAWSPDGKRIASYAYHDGRKTWSIHSMNSDGTNRKRLTHVKNKWDSVISVPKIGLWATAHPSILVRLQWRTTPSICLILIYT